jgi:ribosomal protein L18E
MVKRTGPQTLELKNLIVDLNKLSSKQKVPLWKRISEDLQRPTRIRREVNLYKINKVLGIIYYQNKYKFF